MTALDSAGGAATQVWAGQAKSQEVTRRGSPVPGCELRKTATGEPKQVHRDEETRLQVRESGERGAVLELFGRVAWSSTLSPSA
ncbi:hypothetical protein CesoFtcFv8_015493 [Champsocephalus esox]|uniref:Uncharacterized protein n=1 Tax=Champsocephalus esox TaxID=159716 RepID=A0AAN8GTD7_9TELE|nr:hypothetical protein CesoFtcFv8_015493 [Champsocephalus esox]